MITAKFDGGLAPKSRLNSKSIKVIIICLSSSIYAFVIAASLAIIIPTTSLGRFISFYYFCDSYGLWRVRRHHFEVL